MRRSLLQGCDTWSAHGTSVDVRGPFAIARRLARVRHHGEHLVCAWVRQGAREVARAEAVVQVTQGCTRAGRRLLRARTGAGGAGAALLRVAQVATLVAPRATLRGGG